MPIVMTCPACQHAYRLKDELAGKRVKCKNPACQETFTVTRATQPVAKVTAPPADIDTIAAQALGEEQVAAVPVEQRQIAMSCEVCDHKWSESWDKQGKNVLCPDCRHRQRVPVQKAATPADWRAGRGGPSLARQPELEGVTSSGDAGYVSGESLTQAGLGRPELEPRPLWQKVAVVAVPLGFIAAVSLGVSMVRQSRSGASEAAMMATALEQMPDPAVSRLPKAEVPLARAALQIAAGEYATRRAEGGEVSITQAVKHLDMAQHELSAAQPGAVRDYLYAKLAAATLELGGSQARIDAEERVRWVPQAAGVGKARVSEKVYSVQDELRQLFEVMKAGDRRVPLDDRLTIFRGTVRVFRREGLPNASAQLVPALFNEESILEATAMNLAEQYRSTKDQGAIAAWVPSSVQALAEQTPGPTHLAVANLMPNPPPELRLPALTAAPDDRARLAHGTLALLKGDAAAAVELARRPGKLAARVNLLALAAEWADDPSAAIAAAADVLTTEAGKNEAGPAPDSALLTLVGVAATRGQFDQAEAIAKASSREEAKVLARSLVAAARPPGAEWAVPADESQVRLGHLWGVYRTAYASAVRGTETPAATATGPATPFRLAGAARGHQDRDRLP